MALTERANELEVPEEMFDYTMALHDLGLARTRGRWCAMFVRRLRRDPLSLVLCLLLVLACASLVAVAVGHLTE